MRRLLSVLSLAALCGCQFASGEQYTPTVSASPTPAAASVRHATVSRYVYVTDEKQKALIVYPAHVDNPVPIRTISEASGPIGVATSPSGGVFVSFPLENVVRVYASGGAPLLQTMTKANGVIYPSGLTFDAHGNLWVANRNDQLGQPGYIAEYAPGAQSPTRTIDLPHNFVCAGIAFDPAGDLWADIMASQGGFVIEYSVQTGAEIRRIPLPVASGQFNPNVILGTAGNGGIAFDARGLLQVGTIAVLMAFAPPSPKFVEFKNYGEGSELRELTADANGALYVPIGSVVGHPEVLELPANSAHAPLRITQGLEDPWGAAAGQ